MGDFSAEPSMEDILASIKRVIKEGETPGARRAARIAPDPVELDGDAVLELDAPIAPPTEPAIARGGVTQPGGNTAFGAAQVAAAQIGAAHADEAPAPAPAASMAAGVSAATVEATRGALDQLSRLLVKPEPDSDGTLEGLVRELLRPMLSSWLDRNLPPIVEQMVAREIAKITAQAR